MAKPAEIIRETTDVLVVTSPHADAMDVELRLTNVDPPEGDAHLSGDDDIRPFVGWLGLLHLLWELFGVSPMHRRRATAMAASRPPGERDRRQIRVPPDVQGSLDPHGACTRRRGRHMHAQVEAGADRYGPTLQWLLRISMAGTYIGHGAFGIIGKTAWIPYFNLFGFTESQARALMPVVGTMDIACGILILVWPMRAVMLHLAFWGVLTASFRPLTGEGTWQEVFERAGNYSVPLALLILTGWGGDSVTKWFRRASEAPALTQEKAQAIHWVLRGGTALLLIGHGGCGVWMQKQVWLDYFGALGIDEQVVADLSLFYVAGWFEIALGVAVLWKPARRLLVFVCAYKVGTELLRPMAGEPWWEFIERAGSYVAPVALIVVDRWRLANVAVAGHEDADITYGDGRTEMAGFVAELRNGKIVELAESTATGV